MTCRIPRLGAWLRLGGATFPPDSDSIPPQVLVVTLAVEPVNGAFLVEFQFTEPVYGLLLGEILVNNGVASLLTGSDGDATWGATITPSSSGLVSITIPAGVCQDAFGNLNLVSNTLEVYAVIWLLLDRFITDRVAGAVNGTAAEPSGHIRSVTDTVPNAVITGGKFKITAAAGANDPWIRYTDGWVRSSGLMLRFGASSSGGSLNWLVGFGKTLIATNIVTTAGVLFSPTVIQASRNIGSVSQIASYTEGVETTVHVIMRSTGFFLMVGGVLHYINNLDNTTPLYPVALPRVLDAAVDFRVDDVGISDLSITDPTLYPIPTLSDSFSLPVANDYGDNNLDGVYNFVGLTGTSGKYSGVTFSSTDIFSAGLDTLLNMDEFTAVVRFKCPAGAWTDGVAHHLMMIANAATRYLVMVKNGNNKVTMQRVSDIGTTELVETFGLVSTDYITYGLTVSVAADAFRAFIDGVQSGATQTGFSANPGTFTSARIGSYYTGGTPWLGEGADCIFANVPATPAQMATIHADLAAATLTKATLDGIFGAGNYVWYKQTETYASNGLAHIEAYGGSGVAWSDTADQWTMSANKAYINATAVLGAELLANNSFAAWTGDNPDSWTIVNEVAPDPEVTQRDSGQNHAGTNLVGGSANFYATASATNPKANQANIATQHLLYRIVAVISIRTTGSALLNTGGSSIDPGGAGTFSHFKRATSSTFFQIQMGAGAANDITFDSVSIKELTFANSLRVASPTNAAEPYFRAALTVTDRTMSGLVINLDDGATPANCIHVYYDRLLGRVFARQLIAGVWQADSLSVVTTYSAGAKLEVRRIGNSVYVFYNDAYVGNFTTTVSSANTKVALFATDDASYVQNVELYPTGGYDYSYYV